MFFNEQANVIFLCLNSAFKMRTALNIKSNNKDDYTINNQLLNIHIILNKLKPKIKRTFNLRYNYNLKKIRSISHVSELMCWSEEQTRLVLLDAINEIKLGLKTNFVFF